MGISYEGLSSPFVQESSHGIWRAGYRCPDFVLTNGSGNKRWLYQIVSYGKFIIITVGADTGAPSRLPNLATKITLLPECADGGGSEKSASALEQNNTYTADWLKGDKSYVVAVRPDMYVGMVDESLDKVCSWLEKLERIENGIHDVTSI